tara:strand:- start:55 stop:525 length:471 start_codon:yes stop_codon:yes gene_type:complete
MFVAACATTPRDTAESSGSGSSGTFNSTTSSDEDGAIVPGSQEDLIVNVGDRVFFGYDSFDLDADAQELLQDQAAWLKQHKGVSLTVEGHCDERGTREYNLALGEKRAQAVKNYLVSLGVNGTRVSTISYGKERPAVVGSNEAAWGQNRRSVSTVN